MKFERHFAMPNANTFQIPAFRDMLAEELAGCKVVVDPFARDSDLATHGNDLARGGVDAREYMDGLISSGLEADAVLLDPPYSPRQISECYAGVGIKASGTDTQNARLYRECVERMTAILRPGGKAIRFGWNSCGFGKTRGYRMDRVVLVCHGGAHNDTIATVETLVEKQGSLLGGRLGEMKEVAG